MRSQGLIFILYISLHSSILIRVSNDFRELGYTQQALYCYSKANSLDPTNLGPWWDRATLAREVGDLRVVCLEYLTHSRFLFTDIQSGPPCTFNYSRS